jgi:hypothetical protein
MYALVYCFIDGIHLTAPELLQHIGCNVYLPFWPPDACSKRTTPQQKCQPGPVDSGFESMRRVFWRHTMHLINQTVRDCASNSGAGTADNFLPKNWLHHEQLLGSQRSLTALVESTGQPAEGLASPQAATGQPAISDVLTYLLGCSVPTYY